MPHLTVRGGEMIVARRDGGRKKGVGFSTAATAWSSVGVMPCPLPFSLAPRCSVCACTLTLPQDRMNHQGVVMNADGTVDLDATQVRMRGGLFG